MNDNDSRVAVLDTIGTASIIAAVFAVSVMFYMVLGNIWIGSTGGSNTDNIVPLVIALVGFSSAMSAPMIKKLMFRPSQSGEMAADPKAIVTKYLVATIVSFAVLESAAILGLVASAISGNPNWVYGLGALALVGMALSWPKKEHVREHLSMQMIQ